MSLNTDVSSPFKSTTFPDVTDVDEVVFGVVVSGGGVAYKLAIIFWNEKKQKIKFLISK